MLVCTEKTTCLEEFLITKPETTGAKKKIEVICTRIKYISMNPYW